MTIRARFLPAPAAALLLTAALATIALGCSSSDTPSSTAPATAPPAGSRPAGTVASNGDADAQLAQAKTVAVGFFEAQAVNDWAKALDRSSGAAALTIQWARAVNTIQAANSTPYQVPSVTAPNVRVQLDALQRGTDGLWTATGFVELSFRPGPVVSTTSPSTTTTAPGSPAPTFAVDLVFSGQGDSMKLDDYRLDDTPYPVSQLFMALDPPTQDAGGASGRPMLVHRDLDGSVQYALGVSSTTDQTVTFTESTFTAMSPGPNGSTPGSVLRPAVRGTLFADPLKPDTTQSVLAVYPGLFPGSAGALTLTATASTTTGTGPGTSKAPGTTVAPGVPAVMRWDLPDLPPLTPRPVHTVTPTSTSSTTTSSTTTSSTTSTTTPGVSTTIVVIPPAPTVTPPSTATTSTTSSTSTSTTTTKP